ncbi:MAG: type I restriction enzyme endonuclease domain-containing protein [Actinomycetes bacterium]
MAVLEHLLGAADPDLPDRFLQHAWVAAQAFTLAVSTPVALAFRDDLAFYDAICQNDAAVLELGDDTLKAIAHGLVGIVCRNAAVDWDTKEQVRASLRRNIRRLLVQHGYPSDKQEPAVLVAMQQAELFAGELVA